MSNSRHASPSAPLSQERYLSSPEYAELRGISGNAVAAKAALMAHPAKRSLLFFLQSLSLKPGGLQKFCREFLAMFPDRIGTPEMHRAGIRPGSSYPESIAQKIERELFECFDQVLSVPELADDDDWGSINKPRLNEFEISLLDEQKRNLHSVDYLLKECRERLGTLPGFIVELCINPSLQFAAPGETDDSLRREEVSLQEHFAENRRADGNRPTFSSPSLQCFSDVVGALFEYQRRYEADARAQFVMTEVAEKVFDVLDAGLATGKMVVVEGESRIGKTTATEAWCNLHQGEARFVSLSGISHKTGVFRAIAKAIGIGSTYAHSVTEIQSRIEAVLQRTRLMLVLDEAHHLFSSSERVYSRPELVDWINTSLFNHHVPCALVCTPQFAIRMVRVQKQTTWNADQLRGRVKRWAILPSVPQKQDLEAVARKLLPEGDKHTIQYLVGYALSSKLYLPAIVDAIDEARLLAKRAGREAVTFEDMDTAIRDYCAQSSLAMNRAFTAQLDPKRRGRKPAPAPLAAPDETLVKEPFNAVESPVNNAPGSGRRTNLTGLAPVKKPPASRPQAHALDGDAVEV